MRLIHEFGTYLNWDKGFSLFLHSTLTHFTKGTAVSDDANCVLLKSERFSRAQTSSQAKQS